MKDKIFGVLQRVGRSFMLPIAILPVAGLLLGIGSSFTNETTIATYGLQKILGSGTLLNSLLIIMNKVGSAVFDNLPLIFAVGVAIGMAKKEKEVAALSALIAYFVMNVAVSAMLLINNEITADGQIAADVLEGTITSVCGIQSLQMGVFGGIIVGLGVAALHNRFHKIVLPNALSFFGGSRFIPIISTIVYMFVGILMYFVWPVVQNGIYALGGLVTGSGYLGTLIFGIIKRALIPFGLHHVFYMPFWQTAVGGTMEVAGQVVQGGQNIFFARTSNDLTDSSVGYAKADSVKTNVWTIGVRGEVAVQLYENSKLIPYVGLNYVRLNTDDYTVSNGTHVSSTHQSLWTVPVGLMFTGKTAAASGWTLQPLLDVAYVRSFGDKDVEATTTWGSTVGSVNMVVWAENVLRSRAGIEAQKGALSLGIQGGAACGSDNMSSFFAQVSARYSF